MISTTSEGEVIVEPDRKRRRTTMQNVKLFTDISFLITEGKKLFKKDVIFLNVRLLKVL